MKLPFGLRFKNIRYPIMAIGFLALLLGILGGLKRAGISVPWLPGHLSLHHGGLMVSSFLGTVIAMERAVAVPIKGSLFVPMLTAVGTLILLSGYFPSTGILLITLSSLGVVGLFFYILSTQTSLHNFILLAGGFCWLIGNGSWWLNLPIHDLVSWWLGFLVLVVVAERLELNRIKKFSVTQKNFFVAGATLVIAGMGAGTVNIPGKSLIGVGFLVLAGWLIQNDMVRNMLSMSGQRGYTGWCLFTGYFWLGFGGILHIVSPAVTSGFLYDAYLHSIFVGFIFTMIFGHAFIIMPGVLDLDISYHPGFFLPLGLLEATLLIRIIGDLQYDQWLRSWGSIGNGFAVILFFIMLVETEIRSSINNSAR